MRSLELFNGGAMPALGLGTWHMGESARERKAEVAAIRAAIDMGYRLIDTAEMYGEGGAEEVVGQAVGEALRAGDVTRESLFIVSKVYPHNASRKGTPAACTHSLARLGLDHIDLYLLHWRGGYPLAETCDAMRSLVAQGRIRRWGVSNLDTDDMEELAAACGEVQDCAVNQVYYSVGERGAEFSLQPHRPGRAGAGCGPGEDRAAPGRQRGAARAGLGALAARRRRNPEGGARGASARQPRGRRTGAQPGRPRRHRPPPSAAHAQEAAGDGLAPRRGAQA